MRRLVMWQLRRKKARHFDAAFAKVPPSRYVFNNTCLDILAVAAEMMSGEIAYRKGRFDSAFAHLRVGRAR